MVRTSNEAGAWWPSSDLKVQPENVEAHTGETSLLPGTHLHVQPGKVDARTDDHPLFPETSVSIHQPGQIDGSIGGVPTRIRPFDLQFGRTRIRVPVLADMAARIWGL